MHNVLISFPTHEKRDEFITLLKGISETMRESVDEKSSKYVEEGAEQRKADAHLITQTLQTVRLNPPIKADHERSCGLWVSGQKLLEGTFKDLSTRFEQEVGSHSGSVQLKELVDGEWKTIRQRVIQRPG